MQPVWTSLIGDPNLLGWIIAFSYLLTAALCVRARPAAEPGSLTARERRFWLITAGLFLALGINKQLDLQALVTETGRDIAKAQGWYEYRRMVQLAFIAAIAVAGVASMAYLARLARGHPATVTLALAGIAFTVAFVLIRAASLHHVDALLQAHVLDIRWNWLLELTGISIVAVAALLRANGAERATG